MENRYRLNLACGCNVGKERSNNEDNLYFNGIYLEKINKGLPEILYQQTTAAEPAVVAVLDGMGGGDYGEDASFTGARTIKTVLEATKTIPNPAEFLRELCETLNQAVVERQQDLQSCCLGTTVAMVYLHETSLYICNIGDSRVYCCRDGALRQISRDHTDRELLEKRGIRGRRPTVFQYLGMDTSQTRIEPWIQHMQIQAEDQYLICSDGLTDMVSDREIENILRTASDVQSAAEKLIHLAIEHGGKDNITAILVQVTENGGFSAFLRKLWFHRRK